MTALILSIVSSTLIFVVFKLFERFKIHTLQAIVVNYLVAFTCGIFFFRGSLELEHIPQFSWFPFAIVLGAFFIGIFNLMAWTTQRSGLSVVSVATKMSVVVPILFGLLYYGESLGVLKLIGILLALGAVYLASVKKKTGKHLDRKNILYPILVFLGSGIIDTSLKFLEDEYVSSSEVPLFSAILFLSAAVIGILIVSYMAIKGKIKFEFKNVIGGIALGIPNYFSIYFIVQALKSNVLESSGIFTVNNVAIVMCSTLLGIALFRERLTTKNWTGIILAVVSILLIALAKS